VSFLETWVTAAANWICGLPLLFLISGAGLYFLVCSRFVPYRHFGHALGVLAGRHDDPNAPGEVSHYKALSVALAATVGMGNISNVALAITLGGPGVVFWMWISALVGITTKYFTCSLAVMYRGRDSAGELQGGPMYVITEGLGPR
jgi:AGCS family alanine or glycine:cation symporter